MNMVDIIRKKRDGETLDRAEIEYWISGTVEGSIPDYQSSALLMAIRMTSMTDEETAVLTASMASSGEQFAPNDMPGFTVDKHSTGGVGDTTTLVLLPLLAAAGLTIGKLSGRALGHTGGTIDKLEAIPGFRTDLTRHAFLDLVSRYRFALSDHTDDMCPADRILYELRDVTATVDSLPLIVASIMSKKIAGGAEGIVIDVKTGAGAFLPELEDSRRLARALVAIGTKLGRRMAAVITDMSQPLGVMVGNALEVREAIDTLSGRGPEDLAEVTCELGAELLLFSGGAATHDQALDRLRGHLRDGSALERFRALVEQQGGESAIVDDPDRLPSASRTVDVLAAHGGTIRGLNALSIGRAANLLGAGRFTKEDAIDPAVGVEVHAKIGHRVKEGDALCTLHVNDDEHERHAIELIMEGYDIDPDGGTHRPPPLILERLSESGS